jgi:hypothetical protein
MTTKPPGHPRRWLLVLTHSSSIVPYVAPLAAASRSRLISGVDHDKIYDVTDLVRIAEYRRHA